MNPILPIQYFVPDAEARGCSDGRLYIYGSLDICGKIDFCSNDYMVFSTDDLISWKNHGISFSTNSENIDDEFKGQCLYAPDCIEKDGMYYLYFCTSNGGEGVAVSSTPYGPFTDGTPLVGVHLDGIDPAVFTDDDGKSYIFWGQFQLRGAELSDNMREIRKETIKNNILTENEHGFHEGASIRKRNGIYYMLYTDISSGRATCISYATSLSPLGPYKKGGVIIDNTGCDPQTWNNHGSMSEFKGQWYIFYHRSTRNGINSRRVCIEPIYFCSDGSIKQAEMTTQGVESPVSPDILMDAGRACLVGGSAYIFQKDAEEYICMSKNNDFACYKYYNMSEDFTEFEFTYRGKCSGTIEIRIDSPNGKLIGSCNLNSDFNNWNTDRCTIEKINGIHALYCVLKCNNTSDINIKSFKFLEK